MRDCLAITYSSVSTLSQGNKFLLFWQNCPQTLLALLLFPRTRTGPKSSNGDPWQVCVVSLIVCLSVLNFRAQITANQRHDRRMRISGELSHECGIFGAKNRPLFVRAFFLTTSFPTFAFPLSTTREAAKRGPGNEIAFLISFASVVIVNLSTSWFADVWQTHLMLMSVSWYMVYQCLPTVWF